MITATKDALELYLRKSYKAICSSVQRAHQLSLPPLLLKLSFVISFKQMALVTSRSTFMPIKLDLQ